MTRLRDGRAAVRALRDRPRASAGRSRELSRRAARAARWRSKPPAPTRWSGHIARSALEAVHVAGEDEVPREAAAIEERRLPLLQLALHPVGMKPDRNAQRERAFASSERQPG